MSRSAAIAASMLAGAALLYGELGGAFDAPLDHPAIEYEKRAGNDPVAKLNRKLLEGQVQLKFEGASGYLRSVLEALDVPVESQLAVFSKTSLQARLINPRNPRTIFFNDTVAVAWVRGEPFVEVAAEDPQQGVIFYTLDQKKTDRPQLQRNDSCLQCHESYVTLGVPGTLVRSAFPATDGTPLRHLGDYVPDHRSPMEQRWGGWFVTGKLGAVRHMGNLLVGDPKELEPKFAELRPESLRAVFDGGDYLSPYSDVVAHLVFEHQMHMINLLTRVGWETRWALYEHRSDFAVRVREAAHELADYMLFVDEAQLGGKIQGTSGFQEKFAERGPRDHMGRSLRQFDLDRWLMRYPCSFMIYSEAFEALPSEAKEAIYKHMWDILSGTVAGKKYARLSLADRQAVVEILRETKKDLPDYFRH
jgi:hypothetical protein